MNINQIIKEEDNRILQEELTFLSESIGAATILVPITALIVDAVKRAKKKKILEKGLAACSKYEGRKKDTCIHNYKKVHAEETIKELKKAKKECGRKFKESEKIAKCKETIDKRIKEEKEKWLKHS